MPKCQVWIPVWEQYLVEADNEDDALALWEKGKAVLHDTYPFDGRDDVKPYAEMEEYD